MAARAANSSARSVAGSYAVRRRPRSVAAAPGRLSAAADPRDLNLPGLDFHELQGAGKGTWALGVSGKTLSSILNGPAGLSPEMAVRLSLALNTTAESWLNQQAQHDLWHAERKRKRLRVAKLSAAEFLKKPSALLADSRAPGGRRQRQLGIRTRQSLVRRGRWMDSFLGGGFRPTSLSYSACDPIQNHTYSVPASTARDR